MAFFDRIRGEFIDIVEWLDDSRDTMVWRFPRHDNEIKMGAKLVVRESQTAVFVNEGRIADVFPPGTHTLQTRNLPILSTLKGWKYGFDSPFKAEVYFVSTRQFTDFKWGTQNPIMLRDPEFGPVRLRAFGNYSLKVSQPATLLKEVAGTNRRFTVEEINDQLRDMLTSRFADVLGESKIPALDLAGNYDELGKFMRDRIAADFATFGLEIVTLHVENISLPPEVEAAMDKRTSMGVIGNLNAYKQFQTANAMEQAAKNPGGAGASGIGMGMGFAMAQQMGQAMGNAAQQQTQSPPPLPQGAAFFVAMNGQQAGPFEPAKLPHMVAAGQITRQTLVWRPGMGQWQPAGEVAELSGLFAAVPPPLPPQG
jgi:membrane protease subunit (stomatin/prohibitin family)